MSLNCEHQRTCCLSPRWYMSMERHDGIILTGKTEELGDKPVPVSLCLPQIPYRLTRAQTRYSPVTGRALIAEPGHCLIWQLPEGFLFSPLRPDGLLGPPSLYMVITRNDFIGLELRTIHLYWLQHSFIFEKSLVQTSARKLITLTRVRGFPQFFRQCLRVY
jgi:hypothetical protein